MTDPPALVNNKKNGRETATTTTTVTPATATIITTTSRSSNRDNSRNGDDKDTATKARHCTSLPLFYNNHAENSDLCGIGARPGMECMPLRTPPGPYHYHVADQTKSLQELQNEVGALLEFRDLVIETFPDLKHKMASMSTTNTLTGMASGSSLVSRREWEPGIRVKRKLGQKENSEMSSSLIRSRSNSHSGKKEPKSGEGNGSVVQDSGFSTETSSSKEAHSASSTTGAMQGAVASNRMPIDSDDELLNLLDVIHRKSNRLRDEVEHLQNIERDKFRKNLNLNLSNSSSSCLHKTFQDHVDRLSKEDIQMLRKERDRLLDKLAEMEAETLTGRIKATKIQDQFEELCSVKKELEEQLKLALSQKLELNNRLQDFHKNYSSKSSASSTESPNYRQNFGSVMQFGNATTTSSTPTTVNQLIGTNHHYRTSTITSPTTFTPVQLIHHQSASSTSGSGVVGDGGDFDNNSCSSNKNAYPFHHSDYKQAKNDFNNLGRLDGLVSSPNRVKVRVTDSKKVAAILLETNVFELQRHLLTLTVQNQVLNQRLEQATKSKLSLIEKLGKSKEDIDDMRFQLEEKDIELEGTKAQLRVLESRTASKLDFSTETNRSSSTIILSSRDSPIPPTQISTPSMKAMTPLAMEEIQQHSSSTESAQDQTERDSRLGLETPKRRPSKIPLPGTKGYLAPKPPTGRTSISSSSSSQRSPSGPVSNKSLSRSTGSLYGKSGPSSVKREIFSSSLNRPESAQSLRKDISIGTNMSRSSTTTTSSSIPISSKSTPSPQKISNSPLPKPKRDSLTSRVRHLDSLSRVHTSTSSSATSTGGFANNNNHSSSNYSNNSTITSSVTNLQKSNSKKDLSSSFTQGQLRDRKQGPVSVRRVSSASIGRNTSSVELQQNDTDNGKILRKVRSYDVQEIGCLTSRYGPPPSPQLPTTPSNLITTTTLSSSSSSPSSIDTKSKLAIPSRELIREFMARNSSPPAILKPSYTPCDYSAELELAYKHPQLLCSSRMDQDRDSDTTSSTSTPPSSSSIDDSDKGPGEKQFQNSKYSQVILNPSNVVRNIVKTWEQINAGDSNNTSIVRYPPLLSRSVSNNSDESEQMFYYQQVSENKASFRVNKVIYSEEEEEDDEDLSYSDHFYDSIDDASDNIVSISQQDDTGDDMAHVDSYDRKKYCWSVDSEIEING